MLPVDHLHGACQRCTGGPLESNALSQKRTHGRDAGGFLQQQQQQQSDDASARRSVGRSVDQRLAAVALYRCRDD